jgi:hypothetical protein
MSKGRVWNKGKRNGGGGPLEGKSSKLEAAANASVNLSQEETNTAQSGASVPSIDSRVDSIKPMNRANWVSRPARVTRENPEHKS